MEILLLIILIIYLNELIDTNKINVVKCFYHPTIPTNVIMKCQNPSNVHALISIFIFAVSVICVFPVEFPCADGTSCVPLNAKCNNHFDCDDHSDESTALCRDQQSESPHLDACIDGQFKCRQTRLCIPTIWVCDGESDCDLHDNSDEDHCPTNECLPNQSKCDNDLCIDTERFCDGVHDCGNDEGPACKLAKIHKKNPQTKVSFIN